MNRLLNRKLSFQTSIMALILFLIISLSAVLYWNGQHISSKAALKIADRLFEKTSEHLTEKLSYRFESVNRLAQLGRALPMLMEKPDPGKNFQSKLLFLTRALQQNKMIYSAYVGYENGDFIQVTAVRSNGTIIERHKAPPETEYILRVIAKDAAGVRKTFWTFFNVKMDIVGNRTDSNPSYDPRKRPWYQGARAKDTPYFTAPYIFHFLQIPGITCAARLDGKSIIGLDITLSDFSGILKEEQITPNTSIAVLDHKYQVVAHPSMQRAFMNPEQNPRQISGLYDALEFGDPIIQAVSIALTQARLSQDKTNLLRIRGEDRLVRFSEIGSDFGLNLLLIVVSPVKDFTGHVRQMQKQTGYLSFVIFLLTLPVIFYLSRLISYPLKKLKEEAENVQNFDFSKGSPMASRIKEIDSLIHSFEVMKAMIRERTDAFIHTHLKLEKLVDRGIALAGEKNMDLLMESILVTAKELANADGGTIYIQEDQKKLRFEIMQTDSLDIKLGGTTGEPIALKPVPLYHSDTGEANHHHVSSHAFLSGKTIIIDDAYQDQDFDFSGTRAFDQKIGYRSQSFLTVPLIPRHGEPVGVLQLINAKDRPTGETIPFSKKIITFVEALAAQAAVALDNNNLLAAQKNLFNSFIQLIASAIDTKSPYTGGHCERVPVLADLLAQAANDKTTGPFKDYFLKTEDEWYEFTMAAWLHDCGKITTPEFVVDKATKLETIFNRIHEIRTRFEVLFRDAEIAYYKSMLDGNDTEEVLQKELKRKQDRLREDFEFIAECNVGSEFMSQDKIDRVKAIATQTWLRHFDDTLGLSHGELKRRRAFPVESLPVKETVLIDKPEHIIERKEQLKYDRKQYGIKIDIPQHLYNRGEIYNLCIQRGTLTDEERFIINEHTIQTIVMLSKLPFPKELKRVAEMASTHHETMIGKGYPRRLMARDISISARIITIADIFEALTASDRPYKKAKSLHEAIRIMGFMCNDQHIDADLFNLFLESGIYKDYAAQYLSKEQLDDVNIAEFMSYR